MAKITLNRWDACVHIPLAADQEIKSAKLGEEVEITVKGTIKSMNIREPDEYDKKRGITKSGNMEIQIKSIEMDDEMTEFQVATMKYPDAVEAEDD